jgi:hypothetical protein
MRTAEVQIAMLVAREDVSFSTVALTQARLAKGSEPAACAYCLVCSQRDALGKPALRLLCPCIARASRQGLAHVHALCRKYVNALYVCICLSRLVAWSRHAVGVEELRRHCPCSIR